jgi:hypothetical protein
MDESVTLGKSRDGRVFRAIYHPDLEKAVAIFLSGSASDGPPRILRFYTAWAKKTRGAYVKDGRHGIKYSTAGAWDAGPVLLVPDDL